jgi:hypothetical protein
MILALVFVAAGLSCWTVLLSGKTGSLAELKKLFRMAIGDEVVSFLALFAARSFTTFCCSFNWAETYYYYGFGCC